VSNLRTLLCSTTTILACICAGAALDTAAAQPSRTIRATAPAARAKARYAIRRRHRLHASLARVLSTPCANTELTPQPGNLEQISTATLCLVNQERARNGELPLQRNRQLEQAAWGHSDEMLSEDYFAHVAPSGLTPVGRVEATGYVPNQQVGYTLGENIAWGTLQLSTPSAILAAWIASPEHLANILFSQYRDTAIGVTPAAPASLAEGQPGAIYTQEFGVIVR
jgi:uncharacterized protein YkwD